MVATSSGRRRASESRRSVYPERITVKDLENAQEYANDFLKHINLKVGFRYGYTAIDVTDKDGRIFDTLIAGLTKRQAYDLLYALGKALWLERVRAR